MRKLLLITIILVVGCAVNLQYLPYDGDKVVGYRDGQFSDDTFWVEYVGNFFPEKYAKLRSAELTKENGYKYFVVLKNVHQGLAENKLGFIVSGYRLTIQCYIEKPTNLEFNALDNYATIYEADMVIKNYLYLYNKEEANKRSIEK